MYGPTTASVGRERKEGIQYDGGRGRHQYQTSKKDLHPLLLSVDRMYSHRLNYWERNRDNQWVYVTTRGLAMEVRRTSRYLMTSAKRASIIPRISRAGTELYWSVEANCFIRQRAEYAENWRHLNCEEQRSGIWDICRKSLGTATSKIKIWLDLPKTHILPYTSVGCWRNELGKFWILLTRDIS